ncbi:MAG: GGDEF domain-containing protein [Granulosicoccaceae bacterium]
MGQQAKLQKEPNAVGERDSDFSHQRAVLKVLLGLAVPAGFLFACINFYRGYDFLAICELAFCVSAIFLYRRVERIRRPRLVVACFALPIFAIVSWAIFLPAASVTMFAWVYVIPVLAYTGLGERLGLFLTAAFYTSVGAQFTIRVWDQPEYHDPAAILNTVVVSAAVWGFVHAYEKARNDSQRRLSDLAETDPLTGLNNRLGLDAIFERRRVHSEEQGLMMGLLMVDLDWFKSINDTYGHDCGDEVLRKVAQTLKQSVRAEDVVFRMGGEEFCLLVPRIAKAQLNNTAEAIRERVQSIEFKFGGERVVVTVSIGAVMMGENYQDLYEMLMEADRRLYNAKENGRNQVVFEQLAA